jgi:hypothetical protein
MREQWAGMRHFVAALVSIFDEIQNLRKIRETAENLEISPRAGKIPRAAEKKSRFFIGSKNRPNMPRQRSIHEKVRVGGTVSNTGPKFLANSGVKSLL